MRRGKGLASARGSWFLRQVIGSNELIISIDYRYPVIKQERVNGRLIFRN
jgi:hypothetical protein